MAGGLARGVLVTGASGFLGRHLLDVLAEAGVRTSVLVRPGTDRSGFEGRPVELREADYGDPASLRRAVCGVAAVFHLGAVVDDTNEVRLRAGNVEATRRLATACLETISAPPRFVYASSISAVGPSPSGRPKAETDPCRPVSAYGRSKRAAELAVAELHPDLPRVVLRLPNMLGEGQRQLRATMALIRKRIVPIPGNGDKQTSLCFARDAAKALLQAAQRGAAGVFHVSDGDRYSWGDIVAPLVRVLAPGLVLRLRTPSLTAVASLVEAWAGIAHQAPRLTVHNVRSAFRYYWVFDAGKIRREWGFRPSLAFEPEMTRLAEAYRDEMRAWSRRDNRAMPSSKSAAGA
jgi:nucleoside-diphosphate-sugar epimerase